MIVGAERHLHNHLQFYTVLSSVCCPERRHSYIIIVFFFVFFFKAHSRSKGLICTLEHGLSGWHMYMQSFSFWPAQAKLRGKGSGGGKKKIDMYVDRKTHRQTDRQVLACPPPPPSLILSLPPMCHTFLAAEEPSDWWVRPSVKSVSFKDEWRLLVLFL